MYYSEYRYCYYSATLHQHCMTGHHSDADNGYNYYNNNAYQDTNIKELLMQPCYTTSKNEVRSVKRDITSINEVRSANSESTGGNEVRSFITVEEVR